ncbi:DUF4157 domain-containing protein [Streptomyces sp. NPDC056347]|uniref:eCIS core domain-containing protein n=1 Tax=Streptomyces sp. NPDC056347 TaxID=3345790 RepID=UPI0035D8EB48
MAREHGRRTETRRPSQQGPAGVPVSRAEASQLQQTVGNAAVVQMLRRIGHPWAEPDTAEHQHGAGCDHMDPASAPASGDAPAVQRSTVHDVLRAPGRPMDHAIRADMEARLGADFSDVRIHDDGAARASAAEVGARAYTSGSHVVIGDGGADGHTLAHELTHVIQQRRGPVAGTDHGSGLKVSDPSDRFEREAEANATHVMAGSAPLTHLSDPDRVSAGGGGAAPAQASAASVQRMKKGRTPVKAGKLNKSEWAVTAITEAKAAHLPFPPEWKEGALHHIISKERLQEIGETLVKEYSTSKAAKKFWTTCLECSGEQVQAASTSAVKLLWNLPLNLSIGPKDRAGDPGMGLDLNTEPDGSDYGRRITQSSEALKSLAATWSARDENDPESYWGEMERHLAKSLETAGDRGAGLLHPPDRDQWLYDSETKQNIRKGLLQFPGAEAGGEMFEKHGRGKGNAGIEKYRDSTAVAASGSGTYEHNGITYTLDLEILEMDLHHICERHSFEHFDFEQGKAVNTFWPKGDETETFAELKDLADSLLGEIADLILEEELSGIVDGYVPVENIDRQNVQVGGRTVFWIGTMQDETGEGNFAGRLKTLAPDGASGFAFLKSELNEIGKKFPAVARPPQEDLTSSPESSTATATEAKMSLTDTKWGKRSSKGIAAGKALGVPSEVNGKIASRELEHNDIVLINDILFRLDLSDGNKVKKV